MSTGGFSGEKPPKSVVVYPDGSPDCEGADHTDPNQAVIYRIDNNPNVLRIDPTFARLGGFDKPIVMGMCTARYAYCVLIKTLCPRWLAFIHSL